MRDIVSASNQAIKKKKEMLDEFKAKLSTEPPLWAAQRGPARESKYKRDLEQRIARYEDELAMLNEKNRSSLSDLEKSRFVFKALKGYYRKRHGSSDKFMDLIKGGYSDPVKAVTRLWLAESMEARNALFTEYLELCAGRRQRNPSKPRPSLIFNTFEAVNCFCEAVCRRANAPSGS